MCRILRMKQGIAGNRGSATVEISLIMPIIIYIVVNIIFLNLDSVNDGVIHGEVYTSLYTYDESKDIALVESNIENEISSRLVGGLKMPDINVSKQDNSIGIAVGNVSGRTECGVCTERLRRWQMYGDILWE